MAAEYEHIVNYFKRNAKWSWKTKYGRDQLWQERRSTWARFVKKRELYLGLIYEDQKHQWAKATKSAQSTMVVFSMWQVPYAGADDLLHRTSVDLTVSAAYGRVSQIRDSHRWMSASVNLSNLQSSTRGSKTVCRIGLLVMKPIIGKTQPWTVARKPCVGQGGSFWDRADRSR